MDELLRLLTGRPLYLLPFSEVAERLRLRHLVDRGLQEVPLGSIVGSLGREREFDRAFLPLDESLRQRWEEVRDLTEGPRGFPPVELYKVGEAYFVVDGHHRVSVLRSLGASAIEARVEEFLTPVPLGPEDSIEEVLLKSGHEDFLEATGLERATAGEFRVTVPNGYERLLDHISVHRYYRGIETGRPVPLDEAVISWRDGVYRPMIEAIRKSGILQEFPGRTEGDLYLFTMDHLHHLRTRYGSSVTAESAVRDFVRRLAEGGLLGRLRAFWRYLWRGTA